MSLKGLFEPKSVLLIGSSKSNVSKIMVSPDIFERVCLNLHEFDGHGFLSDIEKSHKYPPADLTVVSLPPENILRVSKDLKTSFLLILSGGFSPDQRRKLKETSKGRFRILGPGTVCGLINPGIGLNTTFERELEIRQGGISVVSQSGGVGAILLDRMVSNNIGISKFVWVGDMLDLNESDILKYLLEDKRTKVVALYLESIREPRRFMGIAKSSKKPIIILKSGISEESKERALTHTDSLSTSCEIYSGAFKQAGITEVDNVKDLLDYAVILERQGRGRIKNVAIVSNTGGSSIIASDFCHRFGLKLSRFSERTRRGIKKKYPRLEVINPLDIRADADGERFKNIVEVVVRDRNVDGVLIINQLRSCLLRPEELEILKGVKTGKIIVDCAPGSEDFRKVKFFLRDSLPVYDSVRDAVKVLKMVSQ
ncbi:MAG: hypothetical protein GTN38_00810 [Candidatus Aenigmarchaeota archaeon]|nr:hypothetical protein [Candidatus Aenigmarchaeota archaeon]NIP40127.1 hypothetical protein [Candidatus Aenigmarchaeota archaeon]NIQ18204.1 hypothetical protein [Candidatus Aenigmarchaeota archaeon]NIS72961.1 hypothetical protein [Candidatus Aenigmarchaeota archaeon]